MHGHFKILLECMIQGILVYSQGCTMTTTVLVSIKEICTYQESNSIFYVCASSKQPPVYLHKVFSVLHFA